MNTDYYAVIMAGGVGSRFWPVSKQHYPKQFHDMMGTGKTLLQSTFDRLGKLVPSENIMISSNAIYKDLILEQLTGISENQLVLEPAMRNTAPCILYAALKIHKSNPNAIMVVAPSDHLIEDEDSFSKDVESCFHHAKENGSICTLGVKPDHPNTGFGYIEYDKSSLAETKKVERFTEKPNLETAKEFLTQGNFLWNAGIFIWSTKTILSAFEKHQPEQFELFNQGSGYYNTEGESGFILSNYPKAENISIDYAILERSSNVFTLPAGFDWNDLGTWGAIYEKQEKDADGNAVMGDHILLTGSKGNMVRSHGKKVVVVDGLEDYIVVDTDDVLLICPKDKQQHIKEIRSEVSRSFGEQFV